MTLSIITINYNDVHGLQKTIDSVLSQTWKDYEWIIIDGGSTDGSKELIEKYQQHFSFWCSEPDKGIYNAMNKGIGHIHGDYAIYLNSADVFYEETTLEKAFAVKRTADVLYGDWVRVLKKGLKTKRFPQHPDLYDFYRLNICQQAMFVRSELLKEEGFDESYRIVADWRRWIRSALRNNSFEYLGIKVCRFDMQGVSSNQSALCDEESERMRQEVFPPMILKTLQRLDAYEHNKFLKFLGKLF